MINISKLLLLVSDKLKPFLIMILPIELLRGIKRKMIKSSYVRLNKLDIRPLERSRYKDGVNLIGNIRAEIGLGQSCRLVANELNASSLDFSILNYVQVSALRMEDHTWDHKISEIVPYNINIIHINPYELALAYIKIDKKVWDYRYNIGFWLWELEEFPDEWTEVIPLLDEIWTPSEFASESIRKKTDKPVYTVPYCVSAPVDEVYDRTYFNLPENKFLYLTMYDSNSTMGRKNPLGAIEAYKKAFENENKGVGLVIKINNMQKKDIEIIQGVLGGYNNVYYITDILQKVQVNSLIKCVDVFVSLHRAEGFGLVLAEAMLVGTPTIATNWSSNTEFMTTDTACLVDYELVTIIEEQGAYKPGYRWAEPNLNMSAEYMLKLYSDTEFYHLVAENAKKHVEECLSMDNAVGLIEKRIQVIYNASEK